MATVLCVLHDDPAGGYPPTPARDGIPPIESNFDGQSAPTPKAIDFKPGICSAASRASLVYDPSSRPAGIG